MPVIGAAHRRRWDSSRQRVCALLASHNRVDLTVACLRSLESQNIDLPIAAVLVDDDSTDDTRQEIGTQFPWVHVAHGDGDLFWAASMSRAESIARQLQPAYYFWLNDDVELFDNALRHLIALSQEKQDAAIISGQTIDPTSGAVSYGGAVRAGWHPLRFQTVRSGDTQRIDVFNGNAILVPARVADVIGRIDGAYAHAYADNDYALRAGALGIASWQLGEPVGTCATNEVRSPIYDPATPVYKRIALARDRRGLPLRSQLRYYRKHAGILWFPLVVASYIRVLFPRRSNRTVE